MLGKRFCNWAAAKRLTELTHPARHREIADAHLPQVVVKVAAEHVEQSLPDGGSGAERRAALGGSNPPCAQPTEHQHEVQHDQLETPLDAVGNSIMGVENRRSGLCHDGAIEGRDIATVVTAPKCT